MSWSGSIQTGANSGEPDSVRAGRKRYPLVRADENGNPVPVTSFDSMEDVEEAMNMRDENGRDLYAIDPAYRMTVQEVIANSPALLAEPTLGRRDVIPSDTEMLRGLYEDAMRQKREQLVDAAGGGDLIAKYQLAQALMDESNFESAHEMQRVTESATPYADYLKGRAAAGLGPEQFSIPTEDLPQEKTLEQRAAEMQLDNSFIITTEGD